MGIQETAEWEVTKIKMCKRMVGEEAIQQE
jgi:hypothetical protein